VNEGGQEGIEKSEGCHSNSYTVHGQRAYEVLHDDPATASRKP